MLYSITRRRGLGVEPTRVVAYSGYEIRVFVVEPTFGNRHYTAAYNICAADAHDSNKHCRCRGAIAGSFATPDDAEDAALKRATASIER